MTAETRIFTPEDIKQYAETRLFGTNVLPEDVQRIELHNAVLPSHLEKIIRKTRGNDFVLVEQPNGREPIYFHDGVIFISQFSGFGRRNRYENMIEEYQNLGLRPLQFQSLELHGDPRMTNIYYENHAYDFVKELFQSGDMKGVNTVILGGPLQFLRGLADHGTIRLGEYLGSQLLTIGGKKAIHIDYVYADQAGILADKMLREYEAVARSQKNKQLMNILMFGRAGGLLKEMRRHELVYPTEIIDEIDLAAGKDFAYRFINVLNPEDSNTGGTNLNTNLNVSNVLNETYEQLAKAKKAGCVCVEMETREAVESINKARRRYRGVFDVNFGFVGYISDLPLIRGDNLSKELNSNKGEHEAAKTIVDYVKK